MLLGFIIHRLMIGLSECHGGGVWPDDSRPEETEHDMSYQGLQLESKLDQMIKALFLEPTKGSR